MSTPEDPTTAETPTDAPVAGSEQWTPVTPEAVTDASETPADTPETASQPEEPAAPAESDVERLKRQLAEAEDAERKQATADAVEAGGEPCPTCGAQPPGQDEDGARQIWCPTCGAQLVNLPEGH